MKTSEHTPSVALRLVSSAGLVGGEPKGAAVVRHMRLVVDDRPRQQLLNTMQLVAAARRHAARRIATKLRVGRTMSILLVAGLAATSLLQGLYAGGLGVAGHRSLAVISLLLIISVLLMFRRQSDERAALAVRDLEACVGGIEALATELRFGRVGDVDLVHDVRRRYTAVIAACRMGHRHSDYLAARDPRELAPPQRLRLRLHYFVDVYLRELALAGLPLLVLVLV